MIRLMMVALPLLLMLTGPIFAQANVELRADHTILASGSTRMVSVEIDNPDDPLRGWAYGLCHDSSVAEVETITFGSAYPAIGQPIGPQFFGTNILDDGLTVGVVVCAHACSSSTLPTGTDWQTEVIAYSIVGPGTTSLSFCDGLGLPPVSVVVVLDTGVSSTPITTDGLLSSAKSFLRGDCNSDGTQNIADSIFVEAYLFLDGEVPLCLEACDSNGDASVNIADSIYSLSYLFSMGTPPPSPHPTCGYPPVEGALTCEFGQCP